MQVLAPVQRANWRIDAYRPVGDPRSRYAFCRAFNNPRGPGWCDKEELCRNDVRGHSGNPILGCVKNGNWTVHGCCRCGSPEHPFTQCVLRDEDLPLADLAVAGAMPPGEPAERAARKEWKKEKYSVPQQTSWDGHGDQWGGRR